MALMDNKQALQQTTTQDDYNAFNDMLKGGNYQGAYNLGKARGFDDAAIASYADSQDGGAWRAATQTPGKTLNQDVANTFGNTQDAYGLLKSTMAQGYGENTVGMDSPQFRNLAGSAKTVGDYWNGMANLVMPSAVAADNAAGTVEAPVTNAQRGLIDTARAQYVGPRMTAAQVSGYDGGKNTDHWLDNKGMGDLTGLSLEARNATGIGSIPAWWLKQNTDANKLATASDPAAYLRQLATQYYSTPESSAMVARSPENEAQWQDMLAKSRSIKDPSSGMYLTLMPNGNYALLNEYGTGRGVYAPTAGAGWNQSGIDPALFQQLAAGGGSAQQFKQVPQDLIERYRTTGNAFATSGGTGATGSGGGTTGSSGGVTTGGIGGGLVTGGSSGGGGGGTPVTTQVTGDELVENRLQNLVNPENQLNQKIRTNVLERANERGLLNSSMAEGAAQSAILDNAQQIAGADAATYTRTRLQNQSDLNAFARAAQAHGFDMETLGAQFAHDFDKMDKTFGQWKEQFGMQRAGQLQDQYVQSVQQMQNQFANIFNNIQNSQMSGEQKTAAFENMQTFRDNALSMYNSLFQRFPSWVNSYSMLAPSYQ